LLNQPSQRAYAVFHRHSRVNTMQIIKIDDIGP